MSLTCPSANFCFNAVLSGGEKVGMKEDKKVLAAGGETSKVEKLLWLVLQTCCSGGFYEVSAAPHFESKELIFPPEVVIDFRFPLNR